MSYHIINIDSPQADVSCKRGQLTCKINGAVKQLPLEDVAAIVITSFSARIHSHLLLEAAKHGVALIICEDFKPVSLMLPANRSSDTLLTKAALTIEKQQVSALWRKTIDAKCMNQWVCANALNEPLSKESFLEQRAKGKAHAKEATCSRLFWDIYRETLADSGFVRKRDGGGLNDLLNYGYAVLLSTVLQKLFALGLDPTLGIGHEVRERSAPLAYDLMEPFRPCIDWRVACWVLQEAEFHDYRITQAFRRYITGFTLEKVGYFGLEMSIQNCIESVVRSFRKAILHKQIRYYKPWIQKNSKWDG